MKITQLACYINVFDLCNLFENIHTVSEKNTTEVLVAVSPFWLEVYGKILMNFKSTFGHFRRRTSVPNVQNNEMNTLLHFSKLKRFAKLVLKPKF